MGVGCCRPRRAASTRRDLIGAWTRFLGRRAARPTKRVQYGHDRPFRPRPGFPHRPSHRPRLEQRLIELEIKASFADDLLEQLNAVVARQQQHIDRLQRELDDLRRLVGDGAPATFRSLRDELPPHY